MAEADDTKAERRVSAATVNDKGAYEETPFGRRRVSKIPKWIAALIQFVRTPIVALYRGSGAPKKPE